MPDLLSSHDAFDLRIVDTDFDDQVTAASIQVVSRTIINAPTKRTLNIGFSHGNKGFFDRNSFATSVRIGSRYRPSE